jgi:H/ACA ribonucleoprotein complex subunit 2
MAKDRDSSKAAHAPPEKEKKKKKRSDDDGVRKPSSDKKEKKEKKAKQEALAEKALNGIQAAPAPAPAPAEAKSDDEEEVAEAAEAKSTQVLRPAGALVPFANPLADDKVAKKVFKSVKKGVCIMILSKTIIWELTCHAVNQRPHTAR